MTPLPNHLRDGFCIGDWQVLPARHVLRRGDEEISPEPKVWGVLMALAAREGAVVTRDELVDEVWDGRPTGDEPINRCISQLRKHLGDSRPYRYIKPVTGSGYLLQEKVVPLEPADTLDKAPARPLRKLWPAVFLIAIVVVVVDQCVLAPPKTGAIRSIVVLPFENASGDSADMYLASGFRDEFVSILKRVRDLSVKTGRHPYAGESAQEIGREFDVDGVLRGTVNRNGNELKVHYEVTRSSSGEVFAANSIKDDVQKVFEVQERLARQVRDELVGSTERELFARSRPSNFDAYNSYLKGLYAFELRGTLGNLENAIAMFEETITHDPGFGPAYLQLAMATALLPAYRGADVMSSNRRAIEIAERGIAVDKRIEAAAGAVFGFVYHSRKEWLKSERAYEQATNATVVDTNAFNWYSRMLASVGRLDASLEESLEAWHMDQEHAVINSRVALSYFWLGDTENAGRFFERANGLGAEGTSHMLAYALYLANQGDIERASEVARIAAARAGFSPEWIDGVLAGMQDESLSATALATVNASQDAGELTPQIEFVTRTLLGDLNGAMRVANLLKEPGEAFEMDLLWIPQFRPLREHPQFLELMRELGVVEYWQLRGCVFEDASVRCSAD